MILWKLTVPFVGFLAGFAPVIFWHYLNWAPFSWSIASGITVSVLASVIWALPNVSPRLRRGAVVALGAVIVGYLLVVATILPTLNCDFEEGELICVNRYF